MFLIISDYTNNVCDIVDCPEDVEVYLEETYGECNIDYFTTTRVTHNGETILESEEDDNG